jgi:hypothetical protein
VWRCFECCDDLLDPGDLKRHLQLSHDIQLSESQLSLVISTAEITRDVALKDTKCPLCLNFTSDTRKAFETHVGKHMEEIALTSLPMEPTDDSDEEYEDSELGDSITLQPDSQPKYPQIDSLDVWIEENVPLKDRDQTPSDTNIDIAKITDNISSQLLSYLETQSPLSDWQKGVTTQERLTKLKHLAAGLQAIQPRADPRKVASTVFENETHALKGSSTRAAYEMWYREKSRRIRQVVLHLTTLANQSEVSHGELGSEEGSMAQGASESLRKLLG